MKKGILGGVAAIVIAVLAGVNMNMSSQSKNLLSDLALANVEALARGEAGGGAYLQCSTTLSGQEGQPGLTHVTYCATCSPILSTVQSLNSTCIGS
ncbi:MAG: NVEALA domain-containing protein [Prevotellaceae bacterium]|jgi:hypothetical protein|nr:NVEALA domain-containing protein [Prevotellaceae bacterium]